MTNNSFYDEYLYHWKLTNSTVTYISLISIEIMEVPQCQNDWQLSKLLKYCFYERNNKNWHLSTIRDENFHMINSLMYLSSDLCKIICCSFKIRKKTRKTSPASVCKNALFSREIFHSNVLFFGFWWQYINVILVYLQWHFISEYPRSYLES